MILNWLLKQTCIQSYQFVGPKPSPNLPKYPECDNLFIIGLYDPGNCNGDPILNNISTCHTNPPPAPVRLCKYYW